MAAKFSRPCALLLLFYLQVFLLLSFIQVVKQTNDSNPVLEVDKISEALWGHEDFKTMSLILKKELHKYQKPCLNMAEKNTITILVPRDRSIYFDAYFGFKPQIVMSKVDEERFALGRLSKGSELRTCHPRINLVVTETSTSSNNSSSTSGGGWSELYVALNSIRISKWNIYKDEHVVVHGVDHFFVHAPRMYVANEIF